MHDQVKAYRNATVAHSQSELAVTCAVGVFDAETLRVRDIAGPTVVVPLPTRVVQQFSIRASAERVGVTYHEARSLIRASDVADARRNQGVGGQV